MIASRRWNVAVAYLLYLLCLWYLLGFLPEDQPIFVSLMIGFILMVAPFWIALNANQLGSLRTATHQLSTPELGLIEAYRRKEEAKLARLESKVKRWM